MNTTENILIGVGVLVLILYRQLAARPVRDNPLRLILILGGIGVFETLEAVKDDAVSAAAVVLTVLGLALGAALGVWRAHTLRLWRGDDGRMWQRGTALTVVLWLVSMGAHLGIDAAGSHATGMATLGTSTILLFIAVSLGTQALVACHRAGMPLTPVR